MPQLSGKVARYAWVRDYHRVTKRRMREFVRGLERELGADIAARWYVDDGADAGPGGGQPRWHWVVRQEHEHFDAAVRVVGVSRTSDYRPGTGA